jgi:protocatechuate 3,4-dioxygenase beta subunit
MRIVIIAAAAAAFAGGVNAQSVKEAPANAPSRIVLADSSHPGARMAVAGRVLSSTGQPIRNASIYAYQTDSGGRYIPGGVGAQGSDRPTIFGYMRSDANGNYSFTTIKPGSYPNSRNPGHIHFEVSAPGHESRVYEIVFEGDPFISDNFRAQARQPFGGVEIVAERRAGNVIQIAHDIRLRSVR